MTWLLLESGDNLLQEEGSLILLENSGPGDAGGGFDRRMRMLRRGR